MTTAESLGQALAHHTAGRLGEAEALYRQILDREPGHPDALHRFGLLAHATGRVDLALDLLGRAVASRPATPEYANSLGIALKDRGRLDEAIGCYERAVALRPEYAEAHSNLSVALSEAGRPQEAAAHGRTAAGLKPGSAEIRLNLAYVLGLQGLLCEAASHCKAALELKPSYAEAWNGMGNILKKRGRPAEAEARYRRAVELRPGYADALSNLGFALQEQGRLEQAVACYRQALALKPALAETLLNLGNALRELGRAEEGAECYRQALSIDPHYAQAENQLMHLMQHLCDWRGLEEIAQRQRRCVLERPGALISPFTLLCIPSTPAEQLACARNLVANRFAPLAGLHDALAFRHRRDRKSRLRIGYLSGDFCQHVMGFLVAELFEQHGRARFEILAYSFGPDDGSPIRKRLIAGCDRFTDIRALSFEDGARRIASDEVDILVDLQGYTTGARTEIVALRPAPVQVNFLGYPGTMGANFVDYIVTDRFVMPEGLARHFSEQPVYLPDCYKIDHARRRIAARLPTREELGLPEKGFVFCCLHNPYKITSGVFDRWLRLLNSIPGSVLWLLETNGVMARNLRREARDRGADPRRLVFAQRASVADHLARFCAADLFLDTLPYNAHTTASDALWVGLPVLTCAGETLASRVAGSLLAAMGLPELITHSLDEYEATALRLAGDASELEALRARIAANRLATPLFDSQRFARHLERAYELMWERFAEGKAVEAIDVPAIAGGQS